MEFEFDFCDRYLLQNCVSYCQKTNACPKTACSLSVFIHDEVCVHFNFTINCPYDQITTAQDEYGAFFCYKDDCVFQATFCQLAIDLSIDYDYEEVEPVADSFTLDLEEINTTVQVQLIVYAVC